MDQRPKLYTTIAFTAGVLVCLAFKDLYPDLERRYRRRFGARKTLKEHRQIDTEQIALEDHESEASSDTECTNELEGIEACIGNTPLFKIKSLSEATGCDIFAKAEVIN